MPRRARRTREKKWGRIMNAISPKALEELEHNLALLAQAGVRPAQEDFPTRYLGKWGEDAAGNLHALLMELGDSDETPDGPRPVGRGIYWLDAECVDNEMAYVDIVSRLGALVADRAQVTDIAARYEEGYVTLSFQFNGKPYRLRMEQQNDWINPALLLFFASCLKENFIFGHLFIAVPDQCFFLFFGADKQAERLGELTGLVFEKL